MASLSEIPLRKYQEVQQDLEATVSRLKRTFDPKARAGLLRQLRVLLEEADLIIESGMEVL